MKRGSTTTNYVKDEDEYSENELFLTGLYRISILNIHLQQLFTLRKYFTNFIMKLH